MLKKLVCEEVDIVLPNAYVSFRIHFRIQLLTISQNQMASPLLANYGHLNEVARKWK